MDLKNIKLEDIKLEDIKAKLLGLADKKTSTFYKSETTFIFLILFSYFVSKS